MKFSALKLNDKLKKAHSKIFKLLCNLQVKKLEKSVALPLFTLINCVTDINLLEKVIQLALQQMRVLIIVKKSKDQDHNTNRYELKDMLVNLLDVEDVNQTFHCFVLPKTM